MKEDQIITRRDDAIRRALNTPRTPARELVGKTERAQSQRESRVIRANRAKIKGPEGA
jgi:hypothetical protein